METEKSVGAGSNGPSSSRSTKSSIVIIVLRLVAIATTLGAAIVLGLAKQTKTVDITVTPTLPPFPVPVTAKSTYSSAFVYSIVANAIACFYSVLSLAVSITNKSRRSNLSVVVADVVVLALLFSGNGAVTAIGVVGERGISNVGWNKVCNVFSKFCASVFVAVVASLVACLSYVLIVLLAIVGLHKKSYPV